MPNKNYIRGRKFEYDLVDDFLLQGYHWAQRMAGSHSPYDVVAVNPITKTIKLVQAKTKLTNRKELKGKRITSEVVITDGWKVIAEKQTKYIGRLK